MERKAYYLVINQFCEQIPGQKSLDVAPPPSLLIFYKISELNIDNLFIRYHKEIL